jgi:hypothetical protein
MSTMPLPSAMVGSEMTKLISRVFSFILAIKRQTKPF